MSGRDATTTTIPRTGDDLIDGVMTGVRWADATIYYSFPTDDSVYDYPTATEFLPNNFNAVTAAQETAVHFAMNDDLGVAAARGFAVEGFTNLGIVEDTTPDTVVREHIRIGETSSASLGTARVSDFPGNYETTDLDDNGDVWFGPYDSYVYRTPTAGNFAWHTHIHELGHALGLKHGHNTGSGVEGDTALPANRDSMEYSIMTYRSYINDPLIGGYSNETWGYAQTWMMADIAALQEMYGADYSTNSGDTVYKWAPGSGDTLVDGDIAIDPGGNRIFATIWDGGGTDTYDLSDYTTDLTLNLTPGEHSVFSATQLANLGDGNTARGNIFNALLHDGDTRSLIENAIGGSGDDEITGNDGANHLDAGSSGRDTLIGEGGNDTLYPGSGGIRTGESFDGGADTDTLEFDEYTGDYRVDLDNGEFDTTSGGFLSTLISIENVNAGNGDDSITGNAADNVLNGGGGADYLDAGSSGQDSLVGGSGNDTLYPGTSGPRSGESFDGGADTDTLEFSGYLNDYRVDLEDGEFDTTSGGYLSTLTSIENVNAGNGDDSITGNLDDNALDGGGGSDTIEGGGGVDTVRGGNGHDTLRGGLDDDSVEGGSGDDLIIVNSGDGLDNVDGGMDTDTLDYSGTSGNITFDMATGAFAYFSNMRTATNFERFLDGSGSSDITGTSGNETIHGNGGDDTLNGGAGADDMVGGTGSDQYIVGAAGDNVTELSGEGTDTVISYLASYTLGDHVERLELRGAAVNGTGNALANTLVGNALDNTLNGGAGADYMVGRTGNDRYIVGAAGDIVVEQSGEGTDTVMSYLNSYTLGNHVERLELMGGAVNGTGNALGNTLVGNGLDNILNGAGGADYMVGGNGNDRYFVGAAGDRVIEFSGQGTDTVISYLNSYTLGDHVERLELQGGAVNGTGNALSNTLVGNALDNTLNGAGGADYMVGGNGNDRYFVAAAGDSVIEFNGQGTDTVISYLNSYTLGDHVERLELQGGAVNGTGNALGNTLVGNALDNTLNGAAGADYMVGGNGNDRYVVAAAGDRVIEYNGQGTDTVLSYLAGYTLEDHVERLELQGAALVGNGNALNNTLVGNGLDNTLRGGNGTDYIGGGAGADDLYGGADADVFVYNAVSDSPAGPGNRDTIFDFEASDRIDLTNIDANGAAPGNGAFGWLGTSGFTSTAGELRFSVYGPNSVVQADVDGDSLADMEILLQGYTGLDIDDFSL